MTQETQAELIDGKYIKMDPPGTWCHYEAVMEMITKAGGNSFIEVGCGAGDLSKKLCMRGYTGVGVDYSTEALKQANDNLREFVKTNQYELVEGDFMEIEGIEQSKDLALSMMVMEHVDDDFGFITRMKKAVKPGGRVIVAVPGRMDRWSIEDETVGHLRRYEREDLIKLMEKAGFEDIKVWSAAVPVANFLFNIGNWMVRRSGELEKTKLDLREQTASSGIREIPYKTVFPKWCKLILNRVTLYPLFLFQKLFYNTGLGLTMLASGKVPEGK